MWWWLALAVALVPLGSVETERLSTSHAAAERRFASWRSSIGQLRLIAWAVGAGVVLVIGARSAALGLASVVAGLCALRLVTTARRCRQVRKLAAAEVAALRSFADELSAGRQAEGALQLIRGGDTPPGSGRVEQAMRVSAGSGIALNSVLGLLIDDLTDEQDRDRAITVGLAATRSSALLMAALPGVGLVLGSALGANPVHVLGGSSLGHALVLVATCLESAGLLWTDAIAERAAHR